DTRRPRYVGYAPFLEVPGVAMSRDANNESRRVYLLQCWQERPATLTEKAVWRFSIEKIARPQSLPQGYASLEALIAFLQNELWNEAGTDYQETEHGK
ncbi:MAG: hypothetical protein AB1801_03950, partial [Chloroflexota bacterium]